MKNTSQNNINTLINECLLTILVDDAIKAREAALGLCEAIEAGPKATVDHAGIILGTLMALTGTSVWMLTLAALMGKIA